MPLETLVLDARLIVSNALNHQSLLIFCVALGRHRVVGQEEPDADRPYACCHTQNQEEKLPVLDAASGEMGDTESKQAANLLGQQQFVFNRKARRLTISCTPDMQYQREFSRDCSSRVYHIEVNNIIAGWTHDSKNPRRKRTAIKEAKLVEAAEQATTTPQMNTFTDRTFAKGSF